MDATVSLTPEKTHQAGTAALGQPSPNRRWTFFDPLRIFVPRRRQEDGGQPAAGTRNWNLFLLGSGAAFSVSATGYQTTGLQLFGISAFGFKPLNSGGMLVSGRCGMGEGRG